ncbi:MAG: toll/interleukin-1 receptor domain-containing protein [Pseudomonadota bacterium]|nr:toll/interleukin-1 receptor domain-containing protein [Pseudomonadota bacterium]
MKAFISYSHVDEHYVERLQKHLAMLKREGLIESFYDRNIHVGDPLDEEISRNLADSEIFIAVVSPDFIASDYCYERELATALELHKAGRIRVVSVIVEPCEWQQSPLGGFLVAPKDGKSIAEWENENAALLNATSEIRRIAEAFSSRQPATSSEKSLPTLSSQDPAPARKYIAKRSFDRVDKYKFRDEGFRELREYFERSVEEINRTDGLSAKFRNMDAFSFTCTVLNEAFGRGVAHVTVRVGADGTHSVGDISWSHDENADASTSHGWAAIDCDDYTQFFEANFMNHFGSSDDDTKLSAEQLASRLWDDLIERAGINYA